MAQAHEILYWLSGGAGNTDPEAALGGARSTAQQTGFQTRDTSAPFAGLTILDGSVVYIDGSVEFVSLDDSLPDVRVKANNIVGATLEITFDVTGGTMTGYTTSGFSTGQERARFRVTGIYATLFANVPDSGNVVFTTPDNNLARHVTEAELLAGVVFYRCFYVVNTSADTLTSFAVEAIFNTESDVFMDFGVDPIGVNGTAQVIADESIAPTGVTFGTSTDPFTLASGDFQSVWVRFEALTGTVPSADRMTTSFIFGDSTSTPVGQGIFATTLFVPAPGEEELVDATTFLDVASETIATLEGPEDTVAFTDVAVASFTFGEEFQVELVTITDLAEAERITHGDIVDSFTLSDATVAHHQMVENVVELVTFDDEAASSGIFNAALIDAIAFFDEASTIGGQREGWTLNLDTNAVSRYLWGPFTSFARYRKRHYAVTNSGVFLLEGDTDDGDLIDAFVLTGLTDLGEEFKKRIKAAYLGVRSTGDLLLKVVVDEATYIYTVQTQGMNALKRARGTVGLGLYGNYWQFGIENAEGVDFELESVKILPLKPIVDGRRKD